MAEFGIEATGLDEPDVRAAGFIRRPSESTTGAQVVTAVGAIGVNLARGKVLADLEGELDTAEQAEADPDFVESMNTGVGIRDAAVDDLSKLAQAVRSGLNRGRARVLAANIVSKAKASTLGSLFGSDIDSAANQFLGTGRGGGRGGFLADLGPTPQERAQAEFEEKNELAVLTTQSYLKGSREQAQDVVASVGRADIDAQLATATAAQRRLNTTELGSATQAMTYSAVMILQGEILQAANENNGALSPEQQQQFRNRIALLEPQLRNGIISLQEGTGTADITAANTIVANAISPLRTMVEDNSALGIATGNASILDKNLDIVMHKSFPELQAMSRLNPELVRMYTGAATNPTLRAIYAKDPNFGHLFTGTGDDQRSFADVVRQGMATLMNPQSPGSGTPKSSAGLGILMGTQGGENLFDSVETDQAMEASRQIASEVPNAVIAYKEPRWQRIVAKNPEKWVPILTSTLATLASKAHLNSITSSGALIADVEIGEEVTTTTRTAKMFRGQVGVSTFQIPGPPSSVVKSSQDIGANARINVQTMHQIALAYPKLWEERFESAIAFVQSLLGITDTQGTQ